MLLESWSPNSIPYVRFLAPYCCRLGGLARLGASQSSSQPSVQYDEFVFLNALPKSFTDLLRVARVADVDMGEDCLAGQLATLGFSLPERLDVQSVFTGTVLVQLSFV